MGRIDGAVVDSIGNPLARVTVTATSPTQIGGKRVAQTNSRGEYHLLGLTPGNFQVRFESEGLKPVVREDLHVGLNEPVMIDAVMEPLVAAETQTIVAAKPVIEARKPTIGQNYDAEFLRNIPLRERSYQQVMALTPGTAVTIAGAGGGELANPNVRGGNFLQNNYTVDGIDSTDYVSHTFGTNFNFDAIAEMQIQTAGLGAEHSMTPGGIANIVTKSGSNDFHLDTSLYYVDENFVAKRRGEETSAFSNVIPNLNLSGPIVKDTLWYFASVEYTRDVRTVTPDPTGALPPHPSKIQNYLNYLVKLTWAPSSRHKLTFMHQGAPGSISNIQNSIQTLPEAELRQEQNSQNYSALWESPLTDNLFVKAWAGFQRITIDVFPEQCQQNPMACLTNIPIIDTTTGVGSGNGPISYHDKRNALRVGTEATYFPGSWLGSHELKFGSKFTYASNPVSQDTPGGMLLLQDGGSPSARILACRDYDPSRPADYDPSNSAASRCQLGAVSINTHGYFWSFYLQDTWSPTRYLHITPGVALDYAETFSDPANGTGEYSATKFVTATPHFYVAWDPTRDGKTKVQAGFNQYVDGGYLYIAQFLSKTQLSRTCGYNATTGQYSEGCSSSGGIGGHVLGKDLTPPRTTEVFFGADRDVGKQLWLGGEFVYRRYDNQFEDVETNAVWNASGTNPVSFKNGNTGQFINEVQTPASAFRRYYGVTLNARKNAGRARIFASWTISKTEGTYADTNLNTPAGWSHFFNTPYLDNPTQSGYYFGPLPDDHRHVIRSVVSYDITDELRFGAGFLYQTGAPYNQFFLNPFTQSYTDFRAPRGLRPNDPNDPRSFTDARLPSLFQLDLHLSYSLKKLIGQDLIFMGDVFNVTNERAPLAVQEENITQGPVKFGDPTVFQQPFQVRLGLRYMY